MPMARNKYGVEPTASRLEFFLASKRINHYPSSESRRPILQLLNSLLLTAYCLLLTAYCLLLTAYCLLLTPDCLQTLSGFVRHGGFPIDSCQDLIKSSCPNFPGMSAR